MTANQAFQKALALSKKYTEETAEGLGAVKGQDGKDGATPNIGLDGNWYINGVDTGVKAVGENGITPHIDPVTKHWMIGETDTGILAEGKNEQGSGTFDYNDLINKPTVNGVEIKGSLSLLDLSIGEITNTEIEEIIAGIGGL